MKIEAIVGPSRLEAVKRALALQYVDGLTVTEVKGPASDRVERYRGAARQGGFTPLLRIEVVVPTPLVPRLLHELQQALRGGTANDDLLTVVPILEAFRIRTGERGEGSL